MNLLLLLSALLSALTGSGGSVRQPQVAQAVAQQARAAVAATVAQRVAARPAQVLVGLPTSAAAPRATSLALLPAESAFAMRRRE